MPFAHHARIANMVRSSNIYELRLFDEPLIRFSFGEEEPALLLDWDTTKEALIPSGLTLNHDGLWRWLSARAIPQNRRFATELCRSLGLSVNDRSGILEISRGLSLNDSYWIVPSEFDGTFADYNLFENDFSAVLAAVAYTGVTSNLQGFIPSTPELTTNGNLRKAWRIMDDGTRCLFKGSSEPGEYGEARVEFLASQVAQAMGLNAVRYGLSSWDEASPDVCSTCNCFCTTEISYIPYALAFGESSHTAAVRSLLQFGETDFEAYASMMVFDSLIYNTDRHLTNFGMLRESRTGRMLGMAPVFDNGRSLFFNHTLNQVEDFDSEAQFVLPSWPQVTFDKQAARLMGTKQITQLERLGDFAFENHDRHPFPAEFLTGLGAFIRHRAESLASLPPISRDAMREQLHQGKRRATE